MKISIVIENYQDEDFKGLSARYVGIPVEVFGTDEKQLLEDLYYAKMEYLATLKKESAKTKSKSNKDTINGWRNVIDNS